MRRPALGESNHGASIGVAVWIVLASGCEEAVVEAEYAESAGAVCAFVFVLSYEDELTLEQRVYDVGALLVVIEQGEPIGTSSVM